MSELRTVFGAPTDSYWRVYYRGDDSYQGGFSPCLKVSWRAPLSLQLQVHDPSHVVVSAVPQGTKVHADVTIAGPYPDTDGLVEVRSYADAACTAGMASSGNRALQDGHVDVTDFERTTTSGTARSFRATYTAWNVSDYLSGTGPCIAVAIIASATTAPPTSPPQGTPTPGPTGVAASPSSSQPPPTPEPAGSAPTASGTPGPSAPASPVGTGTPASPPPTTGQPPPSGPDPTPGAGPVDPSAAGGGFDPMLLIVTVVVAVVAVGSFLLGRRQRGGPAPKPPA